MTKEERKEYNKKAKEYMIDKVSNLSWYNRVLNYPLIVRYIILPYLAIRTICSTVIAFFNFLKEEGIIKANN